MTPKMQHRLVDDYLARLEQALSSLPSQRRREIVADVAEHIDAALAESGTSDVAVLQLLDRLGEPEDIAAEAGAADPADPADPAGPAAADKRRRPAGWLERLAFVLVLFGGALWPLLSHYDLPWYAGCALGVLLLWVSPVFTTVDKLLGTLAPPTGFLAPFFFAATVPQRYETCGFDPAEGPDPDCVTGMTGPPQWVWTTLLVVTLAAALYTAWRLNRRIREAS